MIKITLVGAGSVVFAKTLMCDILQYPALSEVELCLMDIDADRLKVADALAHRIVRQLRVKTRVTSTMDLDEACRGAKFLITMIQVGGYKPGTVIDFEIPKKYGLRQTIADTLGVGGVFRALRTIPALVKIARALQEHGAADPLMINYSNPMAMNMWGIYQATGIDCVGLCHSVQGTSRRLAQYVGVDPEDVTYRVAGINHLAFFLDFKVRGQDAYPLLFKALENPRITSDKVRFEAMRRLGYFPTESSEHYAEYVPYFIHHGQDIIERYDIPLDEYLRRCETIIATWENTQRQMLESDAPVPIRRSVEYGSTIIHSCVTGRASVIYGNVRNNGLIVNLPQGCCVEVPCLVDRCGIQPTVIGELPPQLAALIRTNVNVQHLTVEAALKGKREHVYHAVMMDPHTATVLPLDKIWSMCDEMIEAHQAHGYMPQFEPVKPHTGRPARDLARVYLTVETDGFVDVFSRQFDFVLKLCNELDQPFYDTVTAKFDANHYACELPAEIDVPAGETRRIPFSVKRISDATPALRLDFHSPDPRLLAVGYTLAERERIEMKKGEPTSFTVWCAGEPMAECRVSQEESALAFDLVVHDSDVKINEDSFWDGSVVEFFFANPAWPADGPFQVIAIPKRYAPILMDQPRKPIPGASYTVAFHPERYDARISLPYEAIKLVKGQPFLLDMIVGVTALGDAHGKVRKTWQGSRNALASLEKYALFVP